MKRTHYLIVLMVLLTGAIQAKNDSTQNRLNAMAFRLSVIGGTTMKDENVDPFLKRPMLGGEFAVEFLPTGKWKSLQEWNNSSIGVGVTFINLGNAQILGNAIAVHGHLNTPFYRSKHFAIGIRPTVGVAFCTKDYRNTFPDGEENLYKYIRRNDQLIANSAIGSVMNAYLALELWMDFPIKRGFDITLSGGWHHISNGSVIHPNSGYNMLMGSLGVRYQPGEDAALQRRRAERSATPERALYQRPEKIKPKVLKEIEKKWDIELSATGGLKQNYYRDNYPNMRFYGVATVKVAAHWIPTSIFKIGAGVDAFYDGYYGSYYYKFAPEGYTGPITHYAKTYLATGDIKNCFRVGVSLQPEFIIGNFTAGIHVGFYVFDPIKNLEPFDDAEKAGGSLNKGIFYSYDWSYLDGWSYTQIVLKYRVLKHMFVQLGLKTHGFHAEFLDAGLGVCF